MTSDRANLGARERQILDAVYALGSATANDVVEELDEPAAYDSIRVILGKLARKGTLDRVRDGRRYVYSPAVSREAARRPAMSHLLRTFFAGSTSRAVLAFLDMSRGELSRKELDEIASWVEERAEEASKDG